MLQVLFTILLSLAIPAIALGLIAVMERSRRESPEELQHPGEARLPADFEVTARTRATDADADEESEYRRRKRTG